jgi:hypothetical protein
VLVCQCGCLLSSVTVAGRCHQRDTFSRLLLPDSSCCRVCLWVQPQCAWVTSPSTAMQASLEHIYQLQMQDSNSCRCTPCDKPPCTAAAGCQQTASAQNSIGDTVPPTTSSSPGKAVSHELRCQIRWYAAAWQLSCTHTNVE